MKISIYITQSISLKMEHSNFEIIISQYEEKNTSTIEENVSYYKYNSNTILPLTISNDNNLKCRDFDVDMTTFVTKKKDKPIRKVAKIVPYIEKDFKNLSKYSYNLDFDLYCDMV